MSRTTVLLAVAFSPATLARPKISIEAVLPADVLRAETVFVTHPCPTRANPLTDLNAQRQGLRRRGEGSREMGAFPLWCRSHLRPTSSFTVRTGNAKWLVPR